MPLYEFKCEKCGNVIEMIIGVNVREIECPECKGIMKRQISNINIKFNGKGWSKDGYVKEK